MNEELLEEVKGLVPYVIAAVLAVGGYYAWQNYRVSQRNAASDALVNSYTVEELEEAVAKFGSKDAGGALKLRLAKKYFDGGRFQESLDQYDAMLANPPDGFADIPAVGRAQALEALGKYDEAFKAFEDFASANPKNYLALTAKLGAARVMAQKGDAKGALARIAEMKASLKDDEIAKMRIEALEDCINRRVK